MTPKDHAEFEKDLLEQYRLQGIDAAVRSSPDERLALKLEGALNPSLKARLGYGGLGALGGAAIGGGAGALSHWLSTGSSTGMPSSIRNMAILGSLGGAFTGLNMLQRKKLQEVLSEWRDEKEKTAAARWKRELTPELRELYEKARSLRNLKHMGGAIDEDLLTQWTHKFPRGIRSAVAQKVLDPIPQAGPQLRMMVAERRVPTGIGRLEEKIRRMASKDGIPPSIPKSGPAFESLRDFVKNNKWPLIGIGGVAATGGLALLISKLYNREQDKKLRGEFA